VPAAVKIELESLRDEVRAIATTTASTSPWRLPRTRPQSPLLLNAPVVATSTHVFRESEGAVNGVVLTLTSHPSAAGFTCSVQTPGDRTYSTATRRPVALSAIPSILPVRYMVTYPDDFEGSEPLGPGSYIVEWRASASTEPPEGISPLVWSLIQPPVVRSSFTIPEGQAETSS